MRLKRLLFFLLFLTLTFSFGQTAANKKSIGDTLTIDRNSAIEKRSYTEGFKDNYTAEKYQYEVDAAPNGWFSRLKQWFKDLFIKLFQLNNDVEANKLIDIISRIVYLLIIIVVIYIIVKAILNKEGRWIFGRYSDKKSLNIQDIEANIHKTDFKTLIEQASKEENYRLAIRYYYLWLLKELSEREYIDYDVEKTNSDYINELNDANLKTKFSYTSYLYNYIWYGEFPIEKLAYTEAVDRFENLLNLVRK